MKKIRFTLASDGFYGTYWECPQPSDCAILAALGDDPEDHMARAAVKWLHTLGVHVLSLSPEKAGSGYHNYPPEYVEKAIAWLQATAAGKSALLVLRPPATCWLHGSCMTIPRRHTPIREEEFIPVEKIQGRLLRTILKSARQPAWILTAA